MLHQLPPEPCTLSKGVLPSRAYKQPRLDSKLQALLRRSSARRAGVRSLPRAPTLGGTRTTLRGSKGARGRWRIAAGAGEMAERARAAAANLEASRLDQATRTSARCGRRSRTAASAVRKPMGSTGGSECSGDRRQSSGVAAVPVDVSAKLCRLPCDLFGCVRSEVRDRLRGADSDSRDGPLH
jgi:hypothetical protein